MTQQQRFLVLAVTMITALMCISNPLPAFEIRVEVTPAYQDVLTGHTVTVSATTAGGVPAFDYVVSAHRIERRPATGVPWTIALIPEETVNASPFAPYGPGVHQIPERVIDQQPARFVTVPVADEVGDVTDPVDIADPGTRDTELARAFLIPVQLTRETDSFFTQLSGDLAMAVEEAKEQSTAVLGLVSEEESLDLDLPAGDPVLVISGRYVRKEIDFSYPYGGMSVVASHTYASSSNRVGSFGPEWWFPWDSRVIYGESSGLAAVQSAVEQRMASLGKDSADWVARTFQIRISQAEELLLWLQQTRDQATRSAVALDALRYTGESAPEVRRRIDWLASQARDIAADAGRRADDLAATLVRAQQFLADLGNSSAMQVATQRLNELNDQLLAIVVRSAENNLKNRAGPSVVGPWVEAAAEAGADTITVVDLDGCPRVFRLPEDLPSDLSADLSSSAAVDLTPVNSNDISARLHADGSIVFVDPSGGSIAYGSEGELQGVSDRFGNSLDFDYAETGHLQSATDSLGRVTVIERDPSGRVIQVVAPDGTTTSFGYLAGRLAWVTDEVGDTLRYRYDSSGRLVQIIKPDASTREISYDAAGRAASIVDEEGRRESFEYLSGSTVHTDFDGVQTTYHHDGRSVLRREPETADQLLPSVSSPEVILDSEGRPVRIIYPDGTSETIAYHPTAQSSSVHGTVRSFTDRRVTRRDFSYGADGYVASIEDDLGPVASYRYDIMGRCTVVQNGLGETTNYRYRDDGLLSHIEGPEDLSIEIEYDNRKSITAVVRNGLRYQYRYDASHRLFETVDSEGRVTPLGQVGDVTTPPGNGDTSIARLRFDDFLRRVILSDLAGAEWLYRFDPYGELLSATDPTDRTHTFSHDLRGRVVSVLTPGGSESTYTYDLADRLVQQIGPEGAGVSFAYDRQGRVVTRCDQDGNCTHFNYDDSGRVARITNAIGETTTLTRDGSGLVVSVDREGSQSSWSYHPDGSIASYTDESGAAWRREAESSRIVITDPVGGVTTMELDLNGEVVRIIDPTGKSIDYTRDQAGRIVSVRGGYADVDVIYDQDGRVIAWTNGNGGIRRYTYDNAGNLTAEVDPLGREWRYLYDLAGRLMRTSTPDGSFIEIGYDPDGLLREVRYSEEPTHRVIRNRAGTIITMVNGQGVIDLELEPSGLPATMSQGDLTLHYTWDAIGRPVQTVEPATGRTVFTDYRGTDTIVVSDSVLGTSTLHTDPVGRPEELVLPGGAIARYQYDDAGRPETVMVYGSRVGGTIAGVGWIRDAAGRIVYQTDHTGGLARYEYDQRGRLVGWYQFDPQAQPGAGPLATTYPVVASHGDWSQLNDLLRRIAPLDKTPVERVNATDWARYQYDPAGNLVQRTTPRGTIHLEYDLAGQVLRAGGRFYDYDLNGRLRSSSDGARQVEFGYNGSDRLERIVAPEGTREIRYDGLNRVIHEQTILESGVASDATQQANERVYGYAGVLSTSPLWSFIQTLSQRTAAPTGSQQSRDVGPEPHRYRPLPGIDTPYDTMSSMVWSVGGITSLYDHTFSRDRGVIEVLTPALRPLAVIDSRGQVLTPASADPFGLLTGPGDLVPQFAGGSYDPLSGHYSVGYREYDPVTGRFTTIDPSTDGFNWYAYAAGDPVNRVDPTGLAPRASMYTARTEGMGITGEYDPFFLIPGPMEPHQSPMNSGAISSGYGPRESIAYLGTDGLMHTTRDHHDGLDIAAPEGTPIYCPADGRVVATGFENSGPGRFVAIEHADGSRTELWHLSAIQVSLGPVSTGSVVGFVGSTGVSTGPHVHIQMWDPNGIVRDPQTLLNLPEGFVGVGNIPGGEHEQIKNQ